MFETNEISWHGFPRIELPEGERHRSRKSISIYLYTKDRPAGEIAPSHGTFYVQRPLPERIAPGHIVTSEDFVELRSLLVRRDRWIELYQKMEMDKNRTIDQLGGYVRQLQTNVRLPVTGYVIQEGETSGAYGDGWISSAAKFGLKPGRPVQSLTLYVYRPDEAAGGRVRILIDGAELANAVISSGASEVIARFPHIKEDAFAVEVLFDAERKWSPPADDRDLALMMIEMRVEHPMPGPTAKKREGRLFRW
jgi:hypothetical protein